MSISYHAEAQDVPVRIFSSKIVQILDNILQNAISFSPEQGKITVRFMVDDGQAKIIIEDEGPGIPVNQD